MSNKGLSPFLVKSLIKFMLDLIRILEAAPGLEPGIKVLQTSALPLGYAAFKHRKIL